MYSTGSYHHRVEWISCWTVTCSWMKGIGLEWMLVFEESSYSTSDRGGSLGMPSRCWIAFQSFHFPCTNTNIVCWNIFSTVTWTYPTILYWAPLILKQVTMLQQGLFSHQCAFDVAWFPLLKEGGKEHLCLLFVQAWSSHGNLHTTPLC